MGLPFCVADIPEEKAANIALGTVASKARAALIDACAAYREQDSQVQHHASKYLQPCAPDSNTTFLALIGHLTVTQH